MTNEERFWSKVIRRGADECWPWTGALHRKGYGEMWGGRYTLAGHPKPVRAHRFAYELLVGPIPEGLDLHHECGVANCMNPQHMKPVPRSLHAHITRNGGDPDRCIRGHVLDLVRKNGNRGCKTCRHEAVRRYRARRKAALGIVAFQDRTHCPQGHPYDDENTYEHGGSRHCRLCRREQWQAWYRRDKERRALT